MAYHLAEPWSCRTCKYHGIYRQGSSVERLICMKDRFNISCAFARAQDGQGSCPPTGRDGKPKHFERTAAL